MDKHLRPGNLALGENNAILNVWHGKYSGNYNDIFSKGFFRAYYKLLNPGDIIVLAVQHSELDLVQFWLQKTHQLLKILFLRMTL